MNKAQRAQLLLLVQQMHNLLESLLRKTVGFCCASRSSHRAAAKFCLVRQKKVASFHTFTCTGFIQLPFAEPELRAVHRAGVELQPEHRVPVSGMHSPVVALDLQGAAETGERGGVQVIFRDRRHNEGVWSVNARLFNGNHLQVSK